MQSVQPQELVHRCATDRDPLLWDEFLNRFELSVRASVQRALVRYGARLHLVDREDLTQEVYCRLLERGGRNMLRLRGQSEASVGSYLGRIAKSVVVDHLRSRAAVKRGRHLISCPSGSGDFDLADWAVDGQLSPEEQLLIRERKSGLLECCRQVMGRRTRERDFKVFYLAFFEGRTSREICEFFDGEINPSTVDSLIYRLKKRFGEMGIRLPRRRQKEPTV